MWFPAVSVEMGWQMKLAKKALLLGALLGLVCAGAARADDIYNNLGNTGNGADPIGSDFGPLANSFSTGSSSFDFQSLTVILSGTTSTGTTTAYLLSDSSTSPGSILETIGTISESGISSAPGLFTLSTDYLLSPDTRYWIELTSDDGPDDDSANWQWTLDTSGTGVSGEYIAQFQGSGDWVVLPNGNGPYQMEVSDTNGANVPEPGTLWLAAAGMAALALMASRRGRRKSAA